MVTMYSENATYLNITYNKIYFIDSLHMGAGNTVWRKASIEIEWFILEAK